MGTAVPYRVTVLLLWAQAWPARLPAAACSGTARRSSPTCWRRGGFHDFYPARAHIAWLTETPVLLLVKAGVRDMHLLAMVFSATLFAVPAALYHLALARVREHGHAAGGDDRRGRHGVSADLLLHHRRIQHRLCRWSTATFAIALTRRDELARWRADAGASAWSASPPTRP